MARGDNPAWRAYALMTWSVLKDFNRTVGLHDKEGKPLLDEDGNPRTEKKRLNTSEMTETAIEVADELYAAEIAAEERRIAGKKDADDG